MVGVDGGRVTRARVGVTGAGPCARRATAVEQELVGGPATAESAAQAADHVGDLYAGEFNDDIHASAEYREAMLTVFTRRALATAIQRAG